MSESFICGYFFFITNIIMIRDTFIYYPYFLLALDLTEHFCYPRLLFARILTEKLRVYLMYYIVIQTRLFLLVISSLFVYQSVYLLSSRSFNCRNFQFGAALWKYHQFLLIILVWRVEIIAGDIQGFFRRVDESLPGLAERGVHFVFNPRSFQFGISSPHHTGSPHRLTRGVRVQENKFYNISVCPRSNQ